ncbi:response regulator transcription factor [Clostridium tagluense]|uniref:response regulator transcription factor n=1 Tax=Clostridium tagluense TaxID=360422 RepID=UPI002161B05E|nr:response regulator transcription factor [Clostridium tagluense]
MKIIIADDQPLMRDGLKIIIENELDMSVIGVADNGMAAYKMACELIPDIVLMDIRMPFINGVESTRLIKKEHPEIIILLLTTFDDDEYIADALSFGANGYLLKSIETTNLINCIRKSVCQVTIMDKHIISKISEKLSQIPDISNEMPKIQDFSDREIEIMKMMLTDYSNRAIANACFITEGTVKNYITNIYRKLKTNDRKKAITLLNVFFTDVQPK